MDDYYSISKRYYKFFFINENRGPGSIISVEMGVIDTLKSQ